VVLGRHVPHLSFLHILLGDQPALVAEAQLYQRLLAMDEHGARAVANLYLSENSLVELYDSVMIPALTMAEQDRHKGALDTTREEFLFLSIKEMLSEFSEKTARLELEVETAMEQPFEAREHAASITRVLCLAASDEADEIAAAMLVQLLEQRGCTAFLFPLDSSLEHMLGLVEPSPTDVICISALPPFAFARARTLSRQLQLRFPSTKTLIGVWGFTGDAERALQRFQPLRPFGLATSLADAVKLIGDCEPTASKESAAEAAEFRTALDNAAIDKPLHLTYNG
jgi:hypothetical protein